MSASSSEVVAAPVAKSPRALRSILSNWMGLGINSVVALLMTPILVHGLGDVYYGMWMLVGSLLDSTWLLDFGMRTTVFRFLARYRGSGERGSLDETFASGLAVVAGAVSIILLLTLFATLVFPAWFAVSPQGRPLFSRLLLLGGGSVAAFFSSQYFGTCLCALRRFDLYNLVNTGYGVLRALVLLAVLRLGFGVLGVATATLACSLLLLAASACLLPIADPELSFSLRNIRRTRIRQLLSFSRYAFLGTLGDQLRFCVDSIVIGRVLTIAMITPFNIVGRLLAMFRQAMIALGAPFSGGMSELEGRGQQEDLRSYFLLATRMNSLMSAFIGLLLALNGAAILRLWVGEVYAGTYPLLLVLVVAYCLMLAQQSSGDLLIAKGEHRLRGWWTLCEGVANLGLSIYWGRTYGLMGIALGTAVPMLVVQLSIQPWYTLQRAAIPVSKYFKEALARPLLVSILFAAGGLLAQPWRYAATIPLLAATILAQCAAFALLALLIGLRSDERTRIVAMLRKKTLGAVGASPLD